LLAAGKTEEDKRHLMMACATIGAGNGLEEKIISGGGDPIVYLENKCDLPKEFNMGRSDHRAWALGREIVGFYHISPRFACDRFQEASEFISKFGKSPFVRVSTGLFREVHEDRLPFRDFAVLLSVYAIIGDKQYVIVRKDRVRAGALGYSTAAVLFNKDGHLTDEGAAVLSRRKDKTSPLSYDQARYTVDRLHARKFFSRFQPESKGRIVYYSRSLNHEQLARVVLALRVRKSSADFAQRAAQSSTQKSFSLLKLGQTWESSEKQLKEANFFQGVPSNVPASVPGTVPASVPALIPSSVCVPSYSASQYMPSDSASAPRESVSEGYFPKEPKKTTSELLRELRESLDKP
jgi:hypothetical protein